MEPRDLDGSSMEAAGWDLDGSSHRDKRERKKINIISLPVSETADCLCLLLIFKKKKPNNNMMINGIVVIVVVVIVVAVVIVVIVVVVIVVVVIIEFSIITVVSK